MPSFNTATAVPSERKGSRAASRSGQSPFASGLEQDPSVIESPSATIAAAGPGDRTCTSYTANTCRVIAADGSDGADTRLPALW